jgi:hypothetical protein
MPELTQQIEARTGATLVIIPTENSLFGPTTTTAGLLVGADIRRALAVRDDLDMALIPAETINESGVFLDDAIFEEVRQEFSFPVHPSYDFIDVLSHAEPAEGTMRSSRSTDSFLRLRSGRALRSE